MRFWSESTIYLLFSCFCVCFGWPPLVLFFGWSNWPLLFWTWDSGGVASSSVLYAVGSMHRPRGPSAEGSNFYASACYLVLWRLLVALLLVRWPMYLLLLIKRADAGEKFGVESDQLVPQFRGEYGLFPFKM